MTLRGIVPLLDRPSGVDDDAWEATEITKVAEPPVRDDEDEKTVACEVPLFRVPARLRVERVDVAIRMTATPPMSYVARKLGDDRRLLCASPAYLARRGRPRHPKDLEAHDCLVFYADGAPVPWKVKGKNGKPSSLRLCGPLQTNNTLALRDAALAGLGIADLPLYLVAEDVHTGRLESVLDDDVALERAVYAVYPPGRSVPARSREFVRVLARDYAEGDATSALRRVSAVQALIGPRQRGANR